MYDHLMFDHDFVEKISKTLKIFLPPLPPFIERP